MLNRILGVITLKVPIYREIADDQTGTTQAAVILAIATLIRGFFQGLVTVTAKGTVSTSVGGGITNAIVTLCLGLIGWLVSAWVLAAVAGAFGGKTNTSEMLRVTGYVSVFSLVAVLNVVLLVSPALGCIAGLMGLVVAVLSLIGFTIGVREAAEFSTGKAILTAIIATIVNFLIVAVIGGVVVAAILGTSALAR